MQALPPSFQKLVHELCRLPSIGEKSAMRLAYHLVQGDKGLAQRLSKALVDAARDIRLCSTCFHFADAEECAICRDPSRESELLCVVEKPADVIALERIGEFSGRYHVLHGVWAPLRGQGVESLRLNELMGRLDGEAVQEIILATSSTVEGDATASYIARLVSSKDVRVTRLAQGMPKGGELEYADDLTLSRAFSGRSAVV